MYVEYRDGERELYDLNTDPYELHNLAGGKLPTPRSKRDSRVPLRPLPTALAGPATRRDSGSGQTVCPASWPFGRLP